MSIIWKVGPVILFKRNMTVTDVCRAHKFRSLDCNFSFCTNILHRWWLLKVKIINKVLSKQSKQFLLLNGTRTHNLVRKRTLNHLAKLAKSLSCVVSTYLYGVFGCMLLSCHVRVSKWLQRNCNGTQTPTGLKLQISRLFGTRSSLTFRQQ